MNAALRHLNKATGRSAAVEERPTTELGMKRRRVELLLTKVRSAERHASRVTFVPHLRANLTADEVAAAEATLRDAPGLRKDLEGILATLDAAQRAENEATKRRSYETIGRALRRMETTNDPALRGELYTGIQDLAAGAAKL